MIERTSYEEHLDLDVEDVDLQAIKKKLDEWDQEFYDRYVAGDEDWHAPEYWWSQNVQKLSTLIGHKLDREKYAPLFEAARRGWDTENSQE